MISLHPPFSPFVALVSSRAIHTVFMKQTVLLGILAATAQVVVAAPPACLLAAVKYEQE
jgi:hypothetical protein